MRRHHRVPALAGAVLLIAGPSDAVWAPTEGPEGVPIVSVSVDAGTGNVYLAESTALHRSTDGGLTWQTLGAAAFLTNINDVHAEPGGPLLAGVTHRGVYWSTDGGQTWDHDQITNNPHTGLGASIYAVGIAPGGTWLASSFRSTNGGATWLEMSIYGWAFASSQGRALAATSTGVYASTTDGASWSPSTTGIGSVPVEALAAGAAGRVYAAVQGAGVYRSADAGVTWTPASVGLGSTDVRDIAVDATGRVYAATAGAGVYVSTDEGASWAPTAGSVPDVVATAVATTPSGDVYVGAPSGVVLSSDLGATWEPRNAGLSTRSLSCIAFATSGTGLVGSVGGGIFRSTDGGDSWTLSLSGLGSRLVTTLAETSSGDVLAATWNGVYRSSDDGISWAPSGLAGARVMDVATAPDGTLYAVIQVQTGATTHVSRSSDDGVSWTPVLDEVDLSVPTMFTSGVVDGTGRVYAGGNSFFVDGTVLVSTNAGTTWTETTLGGISISVVAMGAHGADTVYALTDRSGVFVTGDQGATWTQLPAPWSGNGQALLVAPDGELWVGTSSDGIFRSSDGGTTWTAFNDGFAGATGVMSLALHGADAYAGTASLGLFRSPTAAPVAVPDVVSGAARLLAPRPNPFTAGVTIAYELSAAGATRIDVFGVDGRHVRRLVDTTHAAGRHEFVWDGRDAAGRRVAGGTYVLRVEGPGGGGTRTVTLVR